MPKTGIRPKIIVRAVYSGEKDMRELFVSLLVNEVRKGKSSVRTFEIINNPQYNEDSKKTKEAG